MRGYSKHIERAERPCHDCRIASRAFDAGQKALRATLIDQLRAGLGETYRRDEMLIANYGINDAEYQAVLAAQGGGCAICGAEFADTSRRRLVIDHDHDHCPGGQVCRGCVRGILCTPCNVREGKAGDAWAAYLERRWAQSVFEAGAA
jgi:hypothetical protein